MAVSTAYSALTFSGNGSDTAFVVSWQFFDSTDLVVTLIDSAGVETVQTLTTHYSVAGGRDANGLPATGTVTMVTAPASGASLRIERATPRLQSTVLNKYGSFSAKAIEAVADRAMLCIQEMVASITGATAYLAFNTSGGTDYWDASNEILRNLADGVSPTDAVTVSQLAAYTEAMLGVPTTVTATGAFASNTHLVAANASAITLTMADGFTWGYVSRSSQSADDVTVAPPAGYTIEDDATGVVINSITGPVGFIIDPTDATNYLTFTPNVSAFDSAGRQWVGALTVAELNALTGVLESAGGYATDGRKNGEGSGSGTGVEVFYDSTGNWIACDTGATVAA